MSRRFLVIGAFAAIYLLWGSTYFAITLGLKSIPPILLMALRSFCGGIVLLAMSGGQIASVSLRTWVNASLCGLLFFVGCHGVLAFAQRSGPSGVAAVVLATIPFWILLIDVLFPGDQRPRPVALLALVPGTLVLGEPFSRMMLLGAGLVIISVIVIWSAERAGSRRASDPADRELRHLFLRKI
ncbi:EamA family transporter [Bradyrhizobium sp. CCBAU 51627]|uniref:EamA family transporter n=1 Tax=Bradyrhizobium sp. CCBAU 51627 TaxID=1325088 RepID=UPI00230627F8|nr:EamA family transporter [Bradyrhizobium sp. CCBAU 51627]MDA9432671.1 hypothetical protein [Bradyrhizobium sp. CCBAU 51627]